MVVSSCVPEVKKILLYHFHVIVYSLNYEDTSWQMQWSDWFDLFIHTRNGNYSLSVWMAASTIGGSKYYERANFTLHVCC